MCSLCVCLWPADSSNKSRGCESFTRVLLTFYYISQIYCNQLALLCLIKRSLMLLIMVTGWKQSIRCVKQQLKLLICWRNNKMMFLHFPCCMIVMLGKSWRQCCVSVGLFSCLQELQSSILSLATKILVGCDEVLETLQQVTTALINSDILDRETRWTFHLLLSLQR